MSSLSHRIRAAIHFDDLHWERRFDSLAAYGQSKLANLMFSYELQRRLAAATSSTVAVAAHPGFSNTTLDRGMPITLRIVGKIVGSLVGLPAAKGALPTLRAATDPSASGGQYYGPVGFLEMTGRPALASSSVQSRDAEMQRRLWAVSEELTGVSFPV